MELCSIEDAFPDIQKNKKGDPKPGGTDSKASKEERRAARKLAKKCKEGPAEEYYKMVDDKLPPVDSDRPAIKRMGEVPAFAAYDTAFSDLSGGNFESFKMPRLPATNCLISDAAYPAYFGKGLDDAVTPEEGFTNMFVEKPAATSPETFEYEFGGIGNSKAGAVESLPAPPTSNAWKPLTPAKATTAFFKNERRGSGATAYEEEDLSKKPFKETKELADSPPGRLEPEADDNYQSMRSQMHRQIQDLTRRFDEMEARKKRDTQKEIILFVGAGVFILVCMDLVTRMARR
jgi:hypothetical protein